MHPTIKRIGSVLVALAGAVIAFPGLTEATTWTEFGSLFGPLAVLGLFLVAWRAFAGQGQMEIPKAARRKTKLPK